MRHFPFILLLGILAFCLPSCEDPVDPFDPDGPENPAVSGEFQPVPTSGGTVSLGNIAINFPKGSFPSDAQVSITELKKGAELGQDEVSAFYELNLPARIKKSFTVSIKCEEQGDNTQVVAHVPAFSFTDCKSTFGDILLKSTYKNGIYSVTIPEADNDDVEDEDRLTFSIGVANMEYCGKTAFTKSPETRAVSVFDDKYTEGNVSWHFSFSPFFKIANAEKLVLCWDEINETIREAIKHLHDLGLEVTKRDITMTFKDLGIEDGSFAQSAFCNEWSTVQFHKRIIDNFDLYRDKFRRAAIHELMHDFQADYDSRSPYNKAGGLNGKITFGSYRESDELAILYESGAVWAEQFMGGSFSTEFVSNYVSNFVKGFCNAQDILKGDQEANTRYKRYQFHGYGASVLMQYITRGMSEYKLKDKSITELYKIWKKTNYWFSTDGPKNCIKELTKDKGHDLFQLDNYDDFLLSLAQGELIPDISVINLSSSSNGRIGDGDSSAEHSETCYPFGCAVSKFLFQTKDYKSLENKDLVIEQNADGIQTYVIIFSSGKQFEKWGYRATKDNPITISGKELIEYYRKKTGNDINFTIYTVSTTRDNKETLKTSTKVSLVDGVYVEPTELSFAADGGTKNVKVHYGTYKYYGAKVRSEGSGWCGVATASNVSIDITVQPNTTDKKRECIVDIYVSNVKDASEEEKVKMPVKVTQAAGSGNQDGVSINFGYVDFQSKMKAKDSWTEWTEDGGNKSGTKESSREHSFMLTFADEVKKNMTATLKGTTIHAQADYTQSDGYHASLSFDIINFTGDYQKCQATNLVYTANNRDNTVTKSLKIASIPVVSYVRKTDYAIWLWFDATEAQGLKVSSMKDYEYWEGVNFNGHGTDTYTYLSDKSNKAKLDFRFDPPGSSAQAPANTAFAPVQ